MLRDRTRLPHRLPHLLVQLLNVINQVRFMSKGFGAKPPSKTDKLANMVVHYCQQRCPEKLDEIFDALPLKRTQVEHQRIAEKLLELSIAALNDDIESTCWFCGYFAGEINRVEDNEKHGPIENLSQVLIKSGMQPFVDFVPYPGRRIIIANIEKFKTLPVDVQQAVQQFYQVSETSSEEAQLINDAILSELMVTVEE